MKFPSHVLVNAAKTDPVKAILDATDGEGANGVLECSGNATARTQTAMASAWHGCVVIVGAGDVKVSIDTDQFLKKELVVRGNLVCSMTQYYQAVDFLKTHPVRLDDMITHRFRITEAPEAFAVFDSGKTGKVMFEWD